jgi:hypothetical protein
VGFNLKLKLGVNDVPEPLGNTTHGVGVLLEEHYGLFSGFFNDKKDKIVELLEEDIDNAMAMILAGRQPPKNPFGDSSSEIEHIFKNFISSQEAEKVLAPGSEKYPVPTGAALAGKSLRFKGKKKIRQNQGARRPSFIDSGVFQSSIKVWIE